MKLHNHEDYENITEQMPSNKVFQKASEIFQLICDPTRLKIFWLLCHNELCVNNIAFFLNMSAPLVSHHLKLLKQMGLIENRRSGKEMYYRASNLEETELVHKAVDDILNVKCSN